MPTVGGCAEAEAEGSKPKAGEGARRSEGGGGSASAGGGDRAAAAAVRQALGLRGAGAARCGAPSATAAAGRRERRPDEAPPRPAAGASLERGSGRSIAPQLRRGDALKSRRFRGGVGEFTEFGKTLEGTPRVGGRGRRAPAAPGLSPSRRPHSPHTRRPFLPLPHAIVASPLARPSSATEPRPPPPFVFITLSPPAPTFHPPARPLTAARPAPSPPPSPPPIPPPRPRRRRQPRPPAAPPPWA